MCMPLDDKVNVSIFKKPHQIIIIKHTKNKRIIFFFHTTDKEQYYAKNNYNYRRLKKIIEWFYYQFIFFIAHKISPLVFLFLVLHCITIALYTIFYINAHDKYTVVHDKHVFLAERND